MKSLDIEINISEKLRNIEIDHDVKIILAIEAGSRAYGLSTIDSDYDVRFIYVHRTEWYLSVALEEMSDTIELPHSENLDISGWDLRKALRLFWKSNPNFVEWIQSKTIYKSEGSFLLLSKKLLKSVYSAESGFHHYRSMATRSYKRHSSTVFCTKTYLHILRATLSALWLEKNQSPAPIDFKILCSHLISDNALKEEIVSLVSARQDGATPNVPHHYPLIEHFISDFIARPTPAFSKSKRTHIEPVLSKLFRSTLSEAWHAGQSQRHII